MAECWLKANGRPIAMAMALPSLMLVGCVAAWAASDSFAVKAAAAAGAALSALLLATLGLLLRPSTLR